MRKLIGDPLIHFLLIGALLFVVLTWQSDESDPRQIRLTATQVRTALQTMLPGVEYPESRAELEQLVAPLIRDEIFYREALALGLDVEDDEVRTRLIEKMRYISEDLADPEPADDAQLRELFSADPSRFATPELVSFARTLSRLLRLCVRGQSLRRWVTRHRSVSSFWMPSRIV